MSKPQIVHLGTVIQTTFGVVDEAGNVIPQEPLTAKLPAFDRQQFVEAFENLRATRDNITKATNESLKDSSNPKTPQGSSSKSKN